MTDPDGPTGNDEQGAVPLDSRHWVMLLTFTLSSFVVTLDAASLPIPLPSMLNDLGGTLDEAAWVIAAFILTFAVLLIPSVRLADRYGRRLLFISGLTVFTLASLAAALAPSMPFVIGAMAAQGVGAALIEPVVYAMIRSIFSPDRQGLAFGVQSAGFLAGGAIGPLLSGGITTGLSWRYIFALNVAVGVMAIAGAVLVVPESHAERRSRRLDLTGLALSAAGIFLLLFAIIEGERLGWGTAPIVGAFVLAVVLLVLFVVIELHAREPLVDLALFRNRRFALGNIVRAITEFASLGIFFALSHFLQVQLGYPALGAGLLLMSVIAGALLSSPLAETFTHRVDVRWLVIPGFLLLAVGTYWVAHVTPATGWTFFIVPLVVAGAGLGLLEAPTDSAMRRDIPENRSASAWHVSYTTYLLGIGLGVAVVSAIWQRRIVANIRDAPGGAGLPPSVVDSAYATLSSGGISGEPAARIDGLPLVTQLIQSAFADAVNTALLGCVVVALTGAVVALFFSPGRNGSG